MSNMPANPTTPSAHSSREDTIQFVDAYQTKLNAGTYKVITKLQPPGVLDISNVTTTGYFHVAGPRYFLPPSEIHSVFPPEDGAGDYNNVLPHIVLNRHTLPWERIVDKKVNNAGEKDKQNQTRNDVLEQIPFLALLLFTENEEASGDVTPPKTFSLKELGYPQELGEKPTDKVNIINVKSSLLDAIIPTGEELSLLAHGREMAHGNQKESKHPRAVVIANRLPTPQQRHIVHLVMLADCYEYKQATTANIQHTWSFAKSRHHENDYIPLVSLKSWQFTCTADRATLVSRLAKKDRFTFKPICVPSKEGYKAFEPIREMSYVALPHHLRQGKHTYTLYHGPLVASATNLTEVFENQVPASADSLIRSLPVKDNRHIFDVSLSAAWQLGQMLMLRDQSIAMEYFSWRRRDAQLRANNASWSADGHLHAGDAADVGLTPLPDTVRAWCQERLSLHGFPFEYLVPDERMLPENSLRIFNIHQGWMACLLSGALSVGRSGEIDRQLETGYRSQAYSETVCSGFLLRSPAVDEHPELEVVTFDSNQRLKQVRLERLAPGLLLGLYQGTISRLQFSLPSIGLHFGVKEEEQSFVKDLKNEDTGEELNKLPAKVPLNDRRAILIRELRNNIEEQLEIGRLTPRSFAFQMCEGTERVEFQVAGQGYS